MRHGTTELPEEETTPVFFGPDPALALVHADMGAWREAHPCDCEALCVCEES